MNVFIIFAILAVVAFIIFAFVFMYQLRTYEEPLEQETPEVYSYKYQTPFDDKLIELGVKEKWSANYARRGSWPSEILFPSGNAFNDFIDRSFDWKSTPEGFAFWNEISKK